MRNRLTLVAALLSVLSGIATARSVPSPDDKFVVEVDPNRTVLKTKEGAELLELGSDIGIPSESVDVLWAPDSGAVAIVVNYRRGSMVSLGILNGYGKWIDRLDQDEAVATAEERAGGRVIAEQRKLIKWKGDAVEIEGLVITSEKPNGYRYAYEDRLVEGKLVTSQVNSAR